LLHPVKSADASKGLLKGSEQSFTYKDFKNPQDALRFLTYALGNGVVQYWEKKNSGDRRQERNRNTNHESTKGRKHEVKISLFRAFLIFVLSWLLLSSLCVLGLPRHSPELIEGATVGGLCGEIAFILRRRGFLPGC
jgi:hypothetical protein